MAGLLDQLLWQAQGSGFPAVDAAPDEAAMAQAAREVAAERLRKNRGWQTPSFAGPDETSPAVQFALGAQPDGSSPLPFGLMGPQAAAQPAMPAPDAPAPIAGPIPLPQPRPQMPRAGDEADGSQLPPNATPAIGTGTPNGAPLPIAPVAPAAAPAAAVPEGPSFLSKAWSGIEKNAPLLLALGAGFAGAPTIGQGISRASGNAAPIAQKRQDEAAKLALTTSGQSATARALLAKGVSEDDIKAAIGNPELMKALIATNFGKDKLSATIISKDRNGNPVYGSFNSQTGETKPFSVAGNAAPSAGDTAAADGLTGDDFLKTQDPAMASRVKAIVDGREVYPANSRAPDAARIREAVHAYDPTFDSVNYTSRVKTRNDFTSGKSAQNLTAFNTAIGHLGALNDSIDELHNSNFPSWNKLGNAVSGAYDPKFQAAQKKFEASRTAVADELTRAFRGSGGNVHDIKQWEETINAADSPSALKAAVQQAAELLGSRVDAVGDQYNRGMGTTKDALELLNPKAAKAFQHLREGTAKSGVGATPATPAAAAPVSVTTKSSYDALPKGTPYIAPDGSHRVKQ